MRRPLRLCMLFAALALLPGCGSDPSPGDAEPRRTLDPRAEGVRFFGAQTRALAFVRTDMPRPTSELADLAGDYPGLLETAGEPVSLLAASGIEPRALLGLGRDDEGDGPGTELVTGFAPGSEVADLLVVLPTDRPGDLESLFRVAERRGGLTPAGEYDDAKLYRGPEGAFGLRDGVLLAAAEMAVIRRALKTRDGDASGQLDDSDVSAALDEVPTRAPVHLIARRGERFAAVAVRPADGGAELRVFAEVAEDQEAEGEGPHRVTVSTAVLERILFARAGLPQETAAGVAADAPLRGAAYIDGERYIATFRLEER